MILHLAAIAATLATGAAVCAGLYWAFLNTPESNTVTLTASALLVLTIGVAAGVTVNTAVLVARGTSLRRALAAAAPGVFWFLLALGPSVIGWWAVGRVDAWVAAHSGEIHAWLMSRFGWADIGRLLDAQTWVSRWLRWAVFPMLSLSLLATLLTKEGGAPGAPGITRTTFVRRAWHWRPLAIATLVFVLLFALPWQLADWRPQLPPTWVEPAAAAGRLGVVLLLGLAGAAILIIVAARDRATND